MLQFVQTNFNLKYFLLEIAGLHLRVHDFFVFSGLFFR